MTVREAVKKSGTLVALSRASIDAADQLIKPGEKVVHAVAANCSVDNKRVNGALVVTTHRILFCSSTLGKVWSRHILLGDCVGLGDITGRLIGKMKISSENTAIIVELNRDQLAALQAAILDAVASYPNQSPIDFSIGEYAPAEPIIERAAPAPHKPAPPVQRPAAPISKRGQAKQRIKENKAAGVACCPKCGSTSLSANKKGFSAGKAAAGMFLTGGLAGAVAGGIGANKVEVTCLNCGHKFRP